MYPRNPCLTLGKRSTAGLSWSFCSSRKGQTSRPLQSSPHCFPPFFTFIVSLSTGFAELLTENLWLSSFAGCTFFDDDVDGALALQVLLIFHCQGELVCPNLEACDSGNAAVGILQLHTIWTPNQDTRGLVSFWPFSGVLIRLKFAESTGGSQALKNRSLEIRVHDKSKIMFSSYSKIIWRVNAGSRTKSIISGSLTFWLILNQRNSDNSI